MSRLYVPLRLTLLCLIISLQPQFSTAANLTADAIVGVWEVEEQDGHIEIFRCGEKHCGRIFWLKEPLYPANDKRGMGGKPLVDRENPDKELRSRPLQGLRIMEGYTFDGSNRWNDGRIYNTDNGRTYSSRITMTTTGDRLELQGYIGIPLLGGKTVWKRVVRK